MRDPVLTRILWYATNFPSSHDNAVSLFARYAAINSLCEAEKVLDMELEQYQQELSAENIYPLRSC